MTLTRKRPRSDGQDQALVNILSSDANSQRWIDSASQLPQYYQQPIVPRDHHGPYAPTMGGHTAIRAHAIYPDPAFGSDTGADLPTSPGSTLDQMFPTPAASGNMAQYVRDSASMEAVSSRLQSLQSNDMGGLPHYNEIDQPPFAPINSLNGQLTRPAPTALQAHQFQARAHRPSCLSQQSGPLLPSGMGNSMPGRPRSDSGYGTYEVKSPVTRSGYSPEPMGSNPECPSLSLDMNENPFQQIDFSFDPYPDLGQNTALDYFQQLAAFPEVDGPPWNCPNCPDVDIKNRSELKYARVSHTPSASSS